MQASQTVQILAPVSSLVVQMLKDSATRGEILDKLIERSPDGLLDKDAAEIQLLYVLKSLSQARLIEEFPVETVQEDHRSRREVLSLAVKAAVAIPAISSILLPSPSSAMSGAVVLGNCMINGASGNCFGAGTTRAQACAALGLTGTPSVILGQDNTGGNGGCSFSVDTFGFTLDCSDTSPGFINAARCIA